MRLLGGVTQEQRKQDDAPTARQTGTDVGGATPAGAAGGSADRQASAQDGRPAPAAASGEVGKLLPLIDRFLAERTVASRSRSEVGRRQTLAEVELHLSRRLGQILRETVRPGRPREGEEATAGRLPPGISKDRSSKLQRLADIDRETFVRYLERCEVDEKPASLQGALRFARAAAAARSEAEPLEPQRRSRPVAELRRDMVDAIDRFMPVDLLVGDPVPGIDAARRVPAGPASFEAFGGNVLVSACVDPASSLARIAQLWRRAVMLQCIVVVAADTGATWFRDLAQDDWLCCFPTGSTTCLLYQGKRRHGFWTAHQSIGAVFEAPSSARRLG